MEDDDISMQNDEIEALCSIYDNDLTILPSSIGKSFEIKIDRANFRVELPADYPSKSPPKYDIFAPFLTKEDKEELEDQMKDILNSSTGMPVVFALSECLKEFVDEKTNFETQEYSTEKLHTSEQIDFETEASNLSCVECPAILTGDCIEDRKSVFQGHYAKTNSIEEVKAVIAKLYENRKIANATHNMYAYRISQSKENKMIIQDCDDDGETHAGGRMLHLLEILECENVLVVVSRWYGGVQLGPDRFKHINNAARNVLEIAGVVDRNKKDKSKSKRK